jgi:hypothetical protein
MRFRYGLACWLAACVQAWPAFAEPVPEYDLKAAVVYNFALFTEWPADAPHEGAAFNICVRNGSALRLPLNGFIDRQVHGRKIAVHDIGPGDSLRNCQVLYLDAEDRVRWAQIRRELEGASVLTVSEDGEIGRDGSVITLNLDNNRVVFDIDTRAARQARLTISSRLLRLARTVQ